LDTGCNITSHLPWHLVNNIADIRLHRRNDWLLIIPAYWHTHSRSDYGNDHNHHVEIWPLIAMPPLPLNVTEVFPSARATTSAQLHPPMVRNPYIDPLASHHTPPAYVYPSEEDITDPIRSEAGINDRTGEPLWAPFRLTLTDINDRSCYRAAFDDNDHFALSMVFTANHHSPSKDVSTSQELFPTSIIC
jgi:hypothetical protein